MVCELYLNKDFLKKKTKTTLWYICKYVGMR